MLVRLLDPERRYDDLFNAVTKNRDGEFGLSYRAQDFKDGPAELPDPYIKIMGENGNELYNFEHVVRSNAGETEKDSAWRSLNRETIFIIAPDQNNWYPYLNNGGCSGRDWALCNT
ncbi:MAG TPA: hypothetical protein VEW94_01450 [Chloroflexia bacterium]|nr:hypothetical protein [Chloroflexia bacterium]